MEQQYTFAKTESGWWYVIASEHDLNVYDRNVLKERYMKAFANLLYGKEYGNATMCHAPYEEVRELSDFAYYKAINLKKLGIIQEQAAGELAGIHSTQIRDMKKIFRASTLRDQLFETEKKAVLLVNKSGGWHIAKEGEILYTVEDSKFPENNKKIDAKGEECER